MLRRYSSGSLVAVRARLRCISRMSPSRARSYDEVSVPATHDVRPLNPRRFIWRRMESTH